MAMLVVAHELGQPLSVIEGMTTTELMLHVGYLNLRAEKEREAADRAEKSQGGKFKPVVSFKRK